MIKKLYSLFNLLGKEVRLALLLSALVGILIFAAEYGFIIVLQYFLITIGIVETGKLDIPIWLPLELKYSLICLLAVGGLRTLAQMSKGYLTGVANQKFLKQQRSAILRYSIYNAEKLNSHEVTSFFSDTLARAGSAVLDFTGLIAGFTSTLLLLIAGFNLASIEMLVGLIGLSLIFVPIRFLNNKITAVGDGLTSDWELSNKNLLEGLKQNYFFRAHGLEENHISNGESYLKGYEENYNKFFKYSAFKIGLPNITGIFLISTITFLSVRYLNTSKSELLAFLYIFIRLAQGGGELSVTIGHLRLNLAGVDRLILWNKKIKDSDENISNNKLDVDKKLVIQKFVAKDVSFSYDFNNYLLKNINFSLKPGDIYIVIGKSGSGKSTLLSLLLNINLPSHGSVLLNNKSLQEVHSNLKLVTSYVGPEPFLFSASIRDNLLYGNQRENISEEEITHALKICSADEFVFDKEGGLNFVLDEHAKISTGQKQRLSLCRAVLRKPQLLILDEATANIDSVTEKKIIGSIKQDLGGVVTFIVTHKKSLISFGTHTLDLG